MKFDPATYKLMRMSGKGSVEDVINLFETVHHLNTLPLDKPHYGEVYHIDISMLIISRILLKIFQFICSAFVVYCLYNTGPQWMLTLSCLLVPPLGTYLVLRSPNQKNRCDRYYGMVERSWLQVEITLCFTMAVVFLGFGILLLYGFFKVFFQFF
ncbi:hypothetical protein WUBG_10271 [Wuchereria bancrofti]|uniref:Uncharacterized protein n=1 Tax=Wuchereria bancrofti TaxID=6293 RepID=J9E9I8_WUCBA|nr:hypothetical protein WUBG_10271 [Wuchereria bancrofti]